MTTWRVDVDDAMELVVGVDIGTSGLRAQAIDSEKKEIVSTAISLHNPLPGGNVIDHLHFAVATGSDVANKIIVDTVNTLLASLEVELKNVKRLAVCGNPTQLSIFQGIECRDLAFGGDHKLERLGVKRLDRRSTTVDAGSLGLEIDPEAQVFIPPAIRQQIGADALAMLIKSGILEQKECCMVTDYGTNAEIGLKVGDIIYTGSCSAGPAIEGGEIEKGVLASPRAISDISLIDNEAWKVKVLNKDMLSEDSYFVHPANGEMVNTCSTYTEPKGITGTGTIAAMAVGFKNGLIRRTPPYIMTPDRLIHLTKEHDIYFTQKDYINATRCFAAFKSGHQALVEKSGISFNDIKTMYLCGASGTYVDALKAQDMGLVLPTVHEIYQVGNTSLAMADSIALDTEWLDRMQKMADTMKPTYFAFVRDDVFKKAYIVEMDHWEHGLKQEKRLKIEERFKIPHYPDRRIEPKVHRVVVRDIPVFGKKGLHIIPHVGILLTKVFDGCKGCRMCENVCMSKALKVSEKNNGYEISVASERCTGHPCLKCEMECPSKVFVYNDLEFEPGKKAW